MTENTLRDGFQELYTLTGGHKRSLRGCTAIGLVDERSQNLRKRDCILSWDANCILLWENGAVIHELKFPKSKECYICCVAYITKLNVFFGPAMDMSFNIYDQRLRLIESISHEERVILGCCYDIEQDIMVMSGGSGVSVWRIKKCSTGSQLKASNSFLVEKLFAFAGCTEWVSKLIFEPQQNRAYAITDTTVTILNVKSRRVEWSLLDLHETPVTACLWYPCDKFYITACMNGIVRCWFVKERLDEKGGDPVGAAVTLHSFHAHARAVTGLSLHPRRGLLVTAGMDACVKVFDLEAFTQVQSIHTAEGITHFSMGSHVGSPTCLLAHVSGDLVLWRVGSCCSEFASCSSNILKLTPFQNMNEFYSANRSQICYDEGDSLGDGIGFDRYNSSSKLGRNAAQAPAAGPGGLLRAASTSASLSCKSLINQSTVLPQYIADLDKTVHDKLPPIMSRNASEVMEGLLYDEQFQRNNCVIAFAGHDLQVMSTTGAVLSRCTADSLIDGVAHYTFSMFQQLLFCILESGALRVFCTRGPACVLLREVFVGALGGDRACAMQLVEGVSLGPLRASSTSKDMRGDPSPLNVNEAVLIGTENGALLCFDTFQEFSLVLTQQVSKSRVQCLHYRPFRSELVVVARNNITSSHSSVKVFKMPEMILTHCFPCDDGVSVAAVSATENFIIIGSVQGSHQFFKLHEPSKGTTMDSGKRFNLEQGDTDRVTHGRMTEVLHQDSDHVGAITGISFCDKLGVYATSAMDSAVKFWDFKKRCLKAILLDVPSRDVLFNWPVGSLLVTQRDLLQSIPHESWRCELEETAEGERSGDDDDDDDDEEEGEEEEPQSVSAGARPAVSESGGSKPHSGVTFLTSQDDDEAAEMAFLRAALHGNGNLEDYWRQHSSLGVGGSKLTGRRRARAGGRAKQDGGVKFDVRNPAVPVPPRRSKSNYFKRRSQKEQEARLAPPAPPDGDSTGSRAMDGNDLSEDEVEDSFDHQDSSEGEASALEDMAGRKEARGTSAGKSLLIKTKSFVRKVSIVSSRSPTPRGTMASRVSQGYGQSTPKSTLGGFGGSAATAASLRSLLETRQTWAEVDAEAEEEEEDDEGEVELFLKPSGPRARGKQRASFQRAARPQSVVATPPGGKD